MPLRITALRRHIARWIDLRAKAGSDKVAKVVKRGGATKSKCCWPRCIPRVPSVARCGHSADPSTPTPLPSQPPPLPPHNCCPRRLGSHCLSNDPADNLSSTSPLSCRSPLFLHINQCFLLDLHCSNLAVLPSRTLFVCLYFFGSAVLKPSLK